MKYLKIWENFDAEKHEDEAKNFWKKGTHKKSDENVSGVGNETDTKTFHIEYFENIVKRTLKELRDSIENSETDIERNFYIDRYDVQLRDFSEALGISQEDIEFSIS